MLIDFLEIHFLNFDDVCPKTSIKLLNVQTFPVFEADINQRSNIFYLGPIPGF